MKKNALIIALTIISFAFTFEDNFADKIVKQFDNYMAKFPQEKAYIHLDKPYYTAGETLWFKAYVVEGHSHLLDTLSIPLYVELIDNDLGRIVDRKTLMLDTGVAHADFLLSDSLHAGNYRLRAYTNWMQNFDEALFFTKDFKVYKEGQTNIPVKLNSQDIDLQFFPEGGNLVEGQENKLAFKAIDALGNGIDISGIVVSSKGDTIINFVSEHLGMGVFNFKAEPDQTYTAKVKYHHIYEKEVALPKAAKGGFVMGIEAVADDKFMRLYVGHNLADLKGQFLIVGQSRGEIHYTAITTFAKKSVFIKIPKANFPSGITQFTVFDENNKPLCERLVFLKNDEAVNISITPDKKTYLPREKITLAIEAKDEQGAPVEGHFSLVVSDGKQVLTKPDEENILTYLLLSSEIKGKIEQPAYYFSKNNPMANRHLDLLLMTQGWRRFTWDDVLKSPLPQPRFEAEKGINITGEITRLNGKLFEKKVSITFLIASGDETKGQSAREFALIEAEKDGSFALKNLYFKGMAKIMVQAIAGQFNRNTKIFVNQLLPPKVQMVAFPLNAVTFDEKDLADYMRRTNEDLAIEKRLKFEKAQMLKEVMIKARKDAQQKDDRVLYSRASNSIKITPDLYGYGNVIDLIRGRVAGVMVSGSALDPTVTIRGMGSLNGSSGAAFLLDGMPVDKSAILMMPVSDVDRVDVLKGNDASIYGGRGGNGVISVLTRRGDPYYNWNDNKTLGVEIIEKAGYYEPREFYSPKYTEARLDYFKQGYRPDYRSTIFWAPMIETDARGKAEITFYNPDNTTNVNVTLEGISYLGLPAVAKTSYLIKK